MDTTTLPFYSARGFHKDIWETLGRLGYFHRSVLVMRSGLIGPRLERDETAKTLDINIATVNYIENAIATWLTNHSHDPDCLELIVVLAIGRPNPWQATAFNLLREEV